MVLEDASSSQQLPVEKALPPPLVVYYDRGQVKRADHDLAMKCHLAGLPGRLDVGREARSAGNGTEHGPLQQQPPVVGKHQQTSTEHKQSEERVVLW